MFHGAPGGRGMDQLVGWSRGDHGGPVWERFLQEGYVVAVADYRGGDWNQMNKPSSTGLVTAIDDGITVIDYVQNLPYVKRAEVSGSGGAWAATSPCSWRHACPRAQGGAGGAWRRSGSSGMTSRAAERVRISRPRRRRIRSMRSRTSRPCRCPFSFSWAVRTDCSHSMRGCTTNS